MDVYKQRWKKIRKSLTSYIVQQDQLTESSLLDCIEKYFERNMYPLRIDTDFIVKLISDNPTEDDLPLVELNARYSVDRKSSKLMHDRKILFKRFAPAEMVENMSLEEIISRRKAGVTLRVDSSLAEAQKNGYKTIEQMCCAYTSAKKVVDSLQWPVFRFEQLSDEEKSVIDKISTSK